MRNGPTEEAKRRMKTPQHDAYGTEETARRRDEVIKRMLNTPPQPRQQKPRAAKPKARPAQKGRVHRAKSRS
jgi:hypothetical protein